jgi:ankyrin repeat protein
MTFPSDCYGEKRSVITAWDALIFGAMTSHEPTIRKVLRIFGPALRPEGTPASMYLGDVFRVALLWTARNGKADLTVLLLAEGGRGFINNACELDGWTPLAEASKMNHLSVVQVLLRAGANPNQTRTDGGFSVLMQAAKAGYAPIVEALLAHGAVVDHTTTTRYMRHGAMQGRRTALLGAAGAGCEQVVKILISHSADVNLASNDHGMTPLTRAVLGGHTGVVGTLLAASADPNRATDFQSSLMAAAERNDMEVASTLIDHGALVKFAAHDSGETALHVAAGHGHPDMVTLLLNYGADVNAARYNTGDTALMVAAVRKRRHCVMRLLRSGADVNTTNNSGYTILISIARTRWYQPGYTLIVQWLLLYGARVKTVEWTGRSAKTYAVENHKPRMAALLGCVEDWPLFKTAASFRLYKQVRHMLAVGTINPDGFPKSDAMREVRKCLHARVNELWPGAPGPCDATTALFTAAMKPWSPERHCLFHFNVRESVKTLFAVRGRLTNNSAFSCPSEILLMVCSFFLRSDWPVCKI